MRYIVAFLFTALTQHALCQQQGPSQEELKAMLEKMQRKADSMQNAFNRKIESQKEAVVQEGSKSQARTERFVESLELPPKDTVAISTIPTKTLNQSELKIFLSELHTKLKSALPSGVVTSANAIAAQLESEPVRLESAAMHGWQNGAAEEAVLLIVDGAKRAPGDELLLTNAGAILDMSGLSEMAVPILRTVVSSNPRNGVAANNLGQAYAQMGLLDSAMYYFGRCLSLSPQHPEANNTAGLIELKRGDINRARLYFENSIRGGYNLTAHYALRNINRDKPAKIAHLIRPKVKFPEYFNQFKYKLPPQCENVYEAPSSAKQHDEYRRFLEKLVKRYRGLRVAAEKEFNTHTIANLQQRAMSMEYVLRPYQAMAEAMYTETWLDFTGDLMKLDTFNRENRRQYQALEMQLRDDRSAACNVDIQNRYLAKFAALNNDWQEKNIRLYQKYGDELIYWSYLGSMDEFQNLIRFYNWLEMYFQMLQRVCYTKIIEPCSETAATPKPAPEERPYEKFECPFDVQIPFVVGKITVDCERFSFSAGEGIVFKYDKQFTGQRQSTMSIGVGLGLNIPVAAGSVKGGFNAGSDMSAFFVFDKTGALSDGGMRYGAGASVGLGFEAGERIKIRKSKSVAVSAAWRFAYNAGVNFEMEPGPLKGLFNKSASAPQNRNVRPYNPR